MNAASVLDFHGIRKTPFRKMLLALFHDIRSSLTAEEIRCKVGPACDKVTIYRTLDVFEKHGLVHRVPDKTHLVRYALTKAVYDSEKNTHNHAHFICTSCRETFCLDNISSPNIEDFDGFTIKSTTLTLEGICPNCISSNETD